MYGIIEKFKNKCLPNVFIGVNSPIFSYNNDLHSGVLRVDNNVFIGVNSGDGGCHFSLSQNKDGSGMIVEISGYLIIPAGSGWRQRLILWLFAKER